MNAKEAIGAIEAVISALENHIKLAKEGVIEEDCIMCREQDLVMYRGVLSVLKQQSETLGVVKRHAQPLVMKGGRRDEPHYAFLVIPEDEGDYRTFKRFMKGDKHAV